MGQPVSVQCWRLEIADERGTEAWGDHMGGARDSFVGIVETLVTDRHLTGTKYAAQLAQLERVEEDMGVGISRQLRGLDAVHPFSLLDFLYFSFITVSTVGYGDIVPNSTSVRMVVVAQIVLGIWLIVRAGQGGRGRAEDD